MKVTKLVEYLDNNGNVVKKSRKQNLGNVPDLVAKDVFKKSMEELYDKFRISAMSRMCICDKIVNEENKMVLLIKAVIVFEYDQRITFELV